MIEHFNLPEAITPHTNRKAIIGLYDKLEAQDAILLELRDSLRDQKKEQAEIGPALKELVTLWKASKLLGAVVAIISMIAAGGLAIWSWLEAHTPHIK